jgi:hypothetical protein
MTFSLVRGRIACFTCFEANEMKRSLVEILEVRVEPVRKRRIDPLHRLAEVAPRKCRPPRIVRDDINLAGTSHGK